MDFAAIVAAHHKNALERIAASENAKLPSQNAAILKSVSSTASMDKNTKQSNVSSANVESTQSVPLLTMDTDKNNFEVSIATTFPVQTAGHKRRLSPTSPPEASISKTRKSRRGISAQSFELKLPIVADKKNCSNARTSTSLTLPYQDAGLLSSFEGTKEDPINIDMYESLPENTRLPMIPSKVPQVEPSAPRNPLTPIDFNNKATSATRGRDIPKLDSKNKEMLEFDIHKTKAAQTLQVKLERSEPVWNQVPLQTHTPQIPHTADTLEDEPDAEALKLLIYVSSKGEVAPGQKESMALAQLAEYKTTPLFSRAVSSFLGTSRRVGSPSSTTFSQYGLLGMYESFGAEEAQSTMAYGSATKASTDRLLFANMDAPWSAFICGSQGAGKSHTLSCLLETGLVQHSDLNKLPNPLSSIVFHYDKFSGKSSTQLCEAAFLCSDGSIPVNVLVSPSNVWNLKDMYTNLPGLPAKSPRPQVKPLYLSEKHLTTATIMKLMCTDKHGEAPLYVAVVHTILQEMAMQGRGTGNFSYTEFRRRIDQYKWLGGQKGPLEMRLKLLESFLEPSEFTRTTRPAPSKEDIWKFKPGTLTIVDLSDSFIDENDACVLFSICLTIFMESRNQAGQIICLDEAHKFLTQSGEAKALTEGLTSIIRQQRHTGTRVIIATQEPTLSPALMDLVNVTIVHRFLSPAWYETIKQHLAGANKHDGTKLDSLFETIVNLETGEALLFCPTALLTVTKTAQNKVASRLGNDYARIRIRQRTGVDGGKSIMASDTSVNAATAVAVDVPMFVVTRPPTPPRPYGGHPRYNGNRGPPAGQTYHNQPVPPKIPQSGSTPLPPSRPLPTPFVSQNSSIVANDQTASTMGQPNSFSHIQQAVKCYVSQQFASHGWHSPGSISWDKVYREVELVCGLTKGTINNSPLYRMVCTRTGIDQVNDCRVAKGWSRI